MNERIKSLVYEAEKYALNKANDHDGDEDYENTFEDDFQERFAELLVLECINSVMDGSKEGDYYAMRIEQHFDNGQGGILHFGVEE